MVLIVIILVIASWPRAGISFCPSSLPWPVMGGPLNRLLPGPAFACSGPHWFLFSQPPPTWGPATPLAWSPAKPFLGSPCPSRIFEKGTSHQNSQWLPTVLGIQPTLHFGARSWWSSLTCPFSLSLSHPPYCCHTLGTLPLRRHPEKGPRKVPALT